MDTEAQTGRVEAPTGQQWSAPRSDGWQSTPQQVTQIREVRPRGDETKLSIKSSEFWIFLAAVGGVLIASEVVGVNAHHNDYFRADRAWFLIALLTIGYLVSRGLSKAGSATRSKDRDDRRR